MAKIRSILCCLFAVLGLGGAQDDFNQWVQWVRFMDLNYWLTSGEWFPWGIRATFIFLITLLALHPEWHIRMKNKINPQGPTRAEKEFGIGWEEHGESIEGREPE